jgi:hypothetical protein
VEIRQVNALTMRSCFNLQVDSQRESAAATSCL